MLIVRPYGEDDAGRVAAMFGATHALDPSILATTENAWRGFALLSFNRGARDFAVAESSGQIVGVLTSTLLDCTPPCRHFRIIVHPHMRRSRIATRLLSLVREQLLPDGGLLQCNSMRSWGAGNAFLEANGFRLARRELFMRWKAETAPLAGAASDIVIRPYRSTPVDDAAWIRLHEAGYGREPQFSPLVAEDLEIEQQAAGFSLHFAEKSGQAVGFCHAMWLEGGEVGLINSVVVVDPQRGQGIGGQLLAAGLSSLVADGCRTVELNVRAENQAAVRLYQRHGFATFDEQYTYQSEAGRDGACEQLT